MVDKKTIEKVKNFSDDEKIAKLYVFEKLSEHLTEQHQQAQDPSYRGGMKNKRDARRELFRLQVAMRYIKTHLDLAQNFLQKNEKKPLRES